ncbi:serum paraoxonase/arylesterase 2 isoform X1 [Patella vulgata]|uniref:serum paraoxonase/arylesterase 2 isoform X1 n=1 Tax=Patella vulgata TaxID=6465 RepID=UPI00218006ED|nr:serum paraoxonase/arylesterase 2 isoform X1 [Patella vulgata]
MLVKLVVGSLFLYVIHMVLTTVYYMGFHLHYNEHYPGKCENIDGIGLGSEDFHTFTDGLTFITSGHAVQNESIHKREYMVKHNIVGRIYLFDFNKNKAKVEELSIVGSNGGFNVKLFHPHGISGWLNKSGKKVLFVVNHEEQGVDYIEKFEFIPENKQLKHVKRYRDNTMLIVNDVQATSEDSFYFTNTGTCLEQFWIIVQLLGRFAWNTVVYCDGSNYKIVLDDMFVTNGIAMSNDGRNVYIANMGNQEIVVAERKPNNDLVRKQVYSVYTYPDNIIVDMKTDNLYIGAHPIAYKLFLTIDDPVNHSPSQVLMLYVKNGNITKTRELFYDDGELITGSSVAIVFNSKLLIGSVLDKTFFCDVSVPL